MVKKITKSKILQAFTNNYHRRYYLRELADLFGKPHQTIKPYLESLVKEKILLKIKRKNITEYLLNLRNRQVNDYLVIAEKECLMARLNSDTYLQVLYERVSDFFDKNAFIIFGSAVKAIKKGSDIDILIIGKSDIKQTISDYEAIYTKNIHIIQIPTLKQLNPVLAKEIYTQHSL